MPRSPSRGTTLLLFALAIAAGLAVIVRANFSTDLSAFLPAAPDAEQRLLIDQLRQGVAARSLMLGIEGGDAAARARASRDLASALRTMTASTAHTSNAINTSNTPQTTSGPDTPNASDTTFTSVNNGERGDYTAAGEVLLAHRYVLSPNVSAQRFDVDGLNAALTETAMRIASPEGASFKPLWPRDPTGEMLAVAESLLPAQSPRMDGGVWVSRDGSRALLLATLRAASGDVEQQTQAVREVQAAFATVQRAAPELAATRLAVAGHAVYAMQSRELIEREVQRLTIWGTAGVAALLLLAFGRLSALVIAAVPVVTGVVAGVAATALTFGNVHGMTLGFGATLIGEAVDYAIYYLIQARPRSRDAGDVGAGGVDAAGHGAGDAVEPFDDARSRWWRDGWPTVRLGLFTSLVGFAALVFSGFPGLAQLGVFSIAGLIAAALVTRYVMPVMAPQGTPGMGWRRHLARATLWLATVLPKARWPLMVLTLAALVMLLAWPRVIWRGTLQDLSPVPRTTVDIDQRLRADLGASDARTLVIARGATADAAIAAAEAAGTKLDALVEAGVIGGYDTPARLLPSVATQTARRATLPDASTLRARLDQAMQGLPFKATQIEAFAGEVQAARERAPLEARAYDATPLATALESMLFRRPDGTWAALLPLQLVDGSTTDPTAQAKAALRDLPDITVLDVKRSLDAIYAHYLNEARWQSALGALAVVALLGWSLRNARRLAHVLAPLAMAVVLVLALLALLDLPLGVLHLVGLLLVVAVGSNYALFFDHLRRTGQDDADTMASLALANLTTVFAFGLMAVSDIAALAAIGIVVAPGALLALVLSAALVGKRAKA